MRTFLLIVGIAVILMSLISSVITLGRGCVVHPTRARPLRRSSAVYAQPRQPWPSVGDAAFCAFLYAAGFVSLYFWRRLAMRRFLQIIGIAFFLIGVIASVITPDEPRDYTAIGVTLYCAVLYAAGFATLYFRNRLAKGE